MRDEAGQEGQRIWIGRKSASPILARGMLLSDEMIGMVERHKHNNPAAQRIQR